jgi:ubiquinone/menaquinone biosynthesis C-methylase UbiE
MMTHIYAQFACPHGPLGALAGFVMSHRPSNRARNRWTVELIAPKEDARVLEIGCGPGLALAEMRERVPHGLIVGLDHSALMLKQAARRNRRAIEKGLLRLQLGNLDALSLLGGDFDVVYSVNVAMFWKDRRAALQAIRTVMRREGLFATTHQPRHAGSKSADAFAFADRLSNELHETGFTQIRTERLDLKPLPAVCVLAQRAE